MTRTIRLCLFLPLLTFPLAAPAQERPAETERREESRPSQKSSHPSVGLLLRHRAALGLTDMQISRLERIATDLEAKNRPLLRQLKDAGIPVHGHGRDKDRKLTAAEEDELRKKLEAHKPVLHELRANTRAAMAKAHGVLTSKQRDRLRAIMDGEPRSYLEHGPADGELSPLKSPYYGD